MRVIDWFLGKSGSGEVDSQIDIISLAIALCFSAADGSMSPQEAKVVKDFIEQRNGDTRAARRKGRMEIINDVFPKLLEDTRLAFNARNLPQLLEDSCQRLCEVSDQSPAVAIEVIDLCLRVALADKYLNIHEEELLAIARKSLAVTLEHVEHLCQERNLHHDVTIPDDLTFEDSIEFLNSEYRRWRSKSSHDEIAIRSEALGRVQSIVRTRAKLESNQERMQRRVFISHATGDQGFIEGTLLKLLEEHGMEVWYSSDDIEAGQPWERRIRQGLRESGWFLVVLSPQAVQSEWVNAEVHWALKVRPDNFVPIMIEKCEPSDVHLQLSRRHFVDFTQDTAKASQQLAKLWAQAK